MQFAVGEFLEGLAPEDLDVLLNHGRRNEIARGSYAVTLEDVDRDVFFVLQGRAVAELYSANGKAVAFRDLGPGAIFGEIAAIDGAARSANVQAREPMTVLRLTGTTFHDLLEARPGIRRALLTHLAEQVRRMSDRVYEFSTMLSRERLVAELLRLCQRHAPDAREASISPVPTHFDIATRISTHREAVSREMSRLAGEGLVARTRDGLHVPDVERLKSQLNAHGLDL